MGGSQLKSLKAALKAHDLTGQTNIKKNKKQRRQPAKYDREERACVIARIREEFNPFEVKTARNKRNVNSSNSGKDDRVAVGKPGISKQIGEEQRKKAHEARIAIKNKRNGFMDRRFGERNRDLSEEDRMLERFTRERQSQSKKKANLFDLNDGSDDDTNDILAHGLTHLGESLSLEDDFESDDLGFENQRKRLHDSDQLGEEVEPTRKKTKAEVMKEVIAKSKYYKHERQMAQKKLEDQIEDLDENFDDIFSELKDSESSFKKEQPKNNANPVDQEYDTKVRELVMERRAAPTDRTKTEEELQQEAEEKKKKLEQQRLDRMSGILEAEGGESQGVEDLDNQFWDQDDEDSDGGNLDDDIAVSDDDIDLGHEKGEHFQTTAKLIKDSKSLHCPHNHDELLKILKNTSIVEHPSIIKRIISSHQPKLAEGNKERLGVFTGVILRHILFLSDQEYSSNVQKFSEVENSLIAILKNLSEKYNQLLSNECRVIVTEIQKRFKKQQFSGLKLSDLVFFALIGTLFSTSDQYHLVVTPCSLLLGEFLEQIKFNTVQKIAFGAVLVRLTLQYQRLARRYIPEVTFFFEKALATFLSDSTNESYTSIKLDTHDLGFSSDTKWDETSLSVIKLHDIFKTEEPTELKKAVFLNILTSLDIIVSKIWKERPSFIETTLNVQSLLAAYVKKFPSLKLSQQILDKIQRLKNMNKQSPLTLQNHKPVSIPSNAPKYEENFNPDRKSYDPDKERSEINKMKSLIKKERKFTMKEIRKDNKFEARQRIADQKSEARDYHAKMAHIINTINTEEGAEANKYEREKKLRSGKK